MTRADFERVVAAALGLAAVVLGAAACQQGGAASSDAPAPASSVASSTAATSAITAGPPLTAAPAVTTAATPAVTAPLPTASTEANPPAVGCHARGAGLYVLPDPVCTPGAVNPAVTQADIDQTICRSGWTSTVRPPESYTEPLKYQQMAEYGDTGSAGAFEEDHLVPLELGGAPSSPQNLWPEPGASPNTKDSVENAAKRAVCDGQLALAAAQQAIAADWVAFGRQLGVLPP